MFSLRAPLQSFDSDCHNMQGIVQTGHGGIPVESTQVT